MSIRHVRRAITELRERDEIEVWEYVDRYGNRRNAYRVLCGDLRAWKGIPPSELEDEQRAQRGTVRRKVPQALREAVFDRDGYRCVTCGSIDDITIDHILAIANGGTDEITNLQTLCRPCNSAKSDRTTWPVPTGQKRPSDRTPASAPNKRRIEPLGTVVERWITNIALASGMPRDAVNDHLYATFGLEGADREDALRYYDQRRPAA